ncbi:MAG: hypothetical protein LHW57_02460 [Candidatus Cloacimonetes bacterium]|nr:hypothetical protein [Candidatus Cloacimonadota bacterium]
MAVRSRLLILLLLVFAVTLIAQEAPLRLGGKAFILPEDWPRRYDPPEVLIRVLVNPDSTLGLVGVLDGKNELEPLIGQHLLSLQFIPAGDSLSGFDAILEILQAPESPSLQSKQEQDRLLGEIEDWIQHDFASLNFRSPARPPAEQTALNGATEPYRSGFYFYGLPDNSVRRSLHGFEQRVSFYSPVYQDLFALGFLRDRNSALEQAYGQIDYPYPVALSAIEVGIGDYEQLFARGLLRKNRLFGVDSLQAGFGFLIQDGDWLGRDSGREALFFDLSLPLGKTTLDLAVADHRADLSQYYLRPEYWSNPEYRMERHHRDIFAAWRSPWLDLALLHEHDLSIETVYADTLRDDALRLRASKTLRTGNLSLTPLYERMFVWRSFGMATDDHTDLLGLDLGLSTARIRAEAKLELKDFKRFRALADLGYRLGQFRFGLLGSYRNNLPAPLLWAPNPFSPKDSLVHVDIHDNAHLGLYLNWLWGQNSLNLSGGRRVVSTQPSIDLVPSPQPVNYLRFSARIDQTWNNWNLDWQPGIVWQGGYQYLFNEPKLRYQSHLNLSRLLSHHNALFAGFSLLGHSSFLTPDGDLTVREEALIMDIWAGVRIGTRFEFQISYKNLLDSGIYGVDPLPGSLQAALRWYFLN